MRKLVIAIVLIVVIVVIVLIAMIATPTKVSAAALSEPLCRRWAMTHWDYVPCHHPQPAPAVDAPPSGNCSARQYKMFVPPGLSTQLSVCDPRNNCNGVSDGSGEIVGHVPVGVSFTLSANGIAYAEIKPNCLDGQDLYITTDGTGINYSHDWPVWRVTIIQNGNGRIPFSR